MIKNLLPFAIFFACISCSTSKETISTDKEITVDYSTKYAETITAKDLGKHLFVYASDEFEGRDTGEPGQKKASEYLKNFYLKNGIKSPPRT